MDKTATVKDWSIETITTNQTINVLTVQAFLNKDCDCNPKKEENQEYIRVLESQELSNFFMKRFKEELSFGEEVNLSQLTKEQRDVILKIVQEKYKDVFVEYRELFEIYVEKLILVNANAKLRKELLAAKTNEGYKAYTDEFVRQTRTKESTKPLRATIKDRTKTEEVITPVVETTEENTYSIYRLGHVSKSDKVEVKKTAPLRARIK